MNVNEVIKYPLLSEKTYSQMQNGVYTFVVDRSTNKVEVLKTVEFIFDVKVDKVNIINYPKKPKRLGKYSGFTNAIKKAIVTLKEGERINIFPDEEVVSANSKEGKEKDKDKDVQVTKSKKDDAHASEVEKKVAEKIAARAKEKVETSAMDEDLDVNAIQTPDVVEVEVKETKSDETTNAKEDK